jgi:hypothetical protein
VGGGRCCVFLNKKESDYCKFDICSSRSQYLTRHYGKLYGDVPHKSFMQMAHEKTLVTLTE